MFLFTILELNYFARYFQIQSPRFLNDLYVRYSYADSQAADPSLLGKF